MKKNLLGFCFYSLSLFAAKLTVEEQQQLVSSSAQNSEVLNTANNVSNAQKTLFAALHARNRAEMLQLISSASSRDSRDSEGNTLLHRLCGCWIEIDDDSRFELINQLINLGADINAVNNGGNTPLHIGLELYTATVPLLLRLGAKTSIKNKQNQTAAQIRIIWLQQYKIELRMIM